MHKISGWARSSDGVVGGGGGRGGVVSEGRKEGRKVPTYLPTYLPSVLLLFCCSCAKEKPKDPMS